MRKVAVTGGLGAGKSTVCKLLKEYGAYIADSDEIVRGFLKIEHPIGKQVINLLGSEIITENQIDRKKIANIVFSNPNKLKSLEMIIHPAVREEMRRLYEKVKKGDYKLFVAEVPLLFEAHMEDDFDAVVVITAPENLARQRAGDSAEFERRTRFQLPQETKTTKATYVINNDGDMHSLKQQVKTLITKLGVT